MTKFLFTLVYVVFILHTGSCLKCYMCATNASFYDPNSLICNPNAPLFLIDCSTLGMAYPAWECASATASGLSIKSCLPHFMDLCVLLDDEKVAYSSCDACDSDGCNGSSTKTLSFLALFISSIIAVYRFM